MKITRFEDLECWQEARKLVQMVLQRGEQKRRVQKRPKIRRADHSRSRIDYGKYS